MKSHELFGAALLGAAMLVATRAGAQAPSAEPRGAALYRNTCAVCHDAGVPRAPPRDAFAAMAPEQILLALESGSMISMALTLSSDERRLVAEFLAGKPLTARLEMDPPQSARCAAKDARFDLGGPSWTGWGVTAGNSRFQSETAAGITAAQVPHLAIKWAFGLPGDNRVYAAPAIAGGRVFFGSQAGKVYSLDARSGCVRWFFAAGAGVRAGVTLTEIGSGAAARGVAIVADQRAVVRALDAATGAVVWQTRVDDFLSARVTGSPALYRGRLYVPVASNEEAAGAVATYECCKFRGSLVALDVATGKQVWKTYTVEEPRPTTKNAIGTQLFGPSGAPIWSSPAIDPRRNAVYATTGNNYTDPTSERSDAFVAFDLDSGKILWSRQMTTKDAYVAACRMVDKTNCADSNGPDFDFGASPILADLGGGKRVLVAGQKSGVVHALDPDHSGAVLWQQRVGQGGSMGGVQWGSAADGANVYVAVSDIHRIPVPNAWATDADPKVGGGVFALRLRDGERVWHAPPKECGERPRCSPAQPGAVSGIPGAVFSGSMDGHIRAYSTADGVVLWDYDTARSFETVNGVPAHGGSLDGAGPAIASGLVIVNSGYPHGGGMPGNVVLAFGVDAK
ncbi:MAG TPA: PQQ-binding-like beta-propeller repeat protein [Gammaproteobacteria bacterium]|nr:PQQ-binding-like beta-propeller repeat protein [Gammaproteobacteria bacterium]